ncbi:MAG: flagellar biosynthesis protein FlgA, partial [Alphaproteobacteria bacterium]
SLQFGALPIGLAHGVTLTRPIKEGEIVRWQDILADEDSEPVRTRREMERTFGGE